MRKLKRPDGDLIEEYVTASCHFFEDGKLAGHDNDSDAGMYTGRFQFIFRDGSYTRWYREKSAPKWLLAMYFEATTPPEFQTIELEFQIADPDEPCARCEAAKDEP